MKQKLFLFSMLLWIPLFTNCEQEISSFKEQETTVNLTRNSNFPRSVGVATYNLHLFLGPSLFEDAIRQKAIVAFIKSSLTHNDVLFLTEVWNDSTKNELIESLKNTFPHSNHSNAVNTTQGDGLLILSKFPILFTKFTVFKDASGFDQFAPKGFHRTRFGTPNGDFVSFFTHTQADADQFKTRKKQLEQIKKDMSYLQAPSIIVGDLNIIGESEEYRTALKTIFPDYRDSFRKTNPTAPGFTYTNLENTLANYFYPSKTSKSEERLDYILFSKDWTIHTSKVIDNCTYNSKYFKKSGTMFGPLWP